MQTTAAQLGFSDSTVSVPKSRADDLKMIRLARAHYSACPSSILRTGII